MIHKFNGLYAYSKEVISGWESTDTGVYYCGIKNPNGSLNTYYVGKGTGKDGIRGRLLDHLRDGEWPDITHFGFRICDTIKEADDFEEAEIKRLKPKHNQIGKTSTRF